MGKDFNVNPQLANCYKSSKERRALTAQEKAEARQAYINYTMNNIPDDGRKGKSFEVEFRATVNPQSSVLKCQRPTAKDCAVKIDGKFVNVECKTGAGELAKGFWDTVEEFKNGFNAETDFTFDYLAYCRDWTSDSDVYTDAIIFTKTAFINFLENWNKGILGMLTYQKDKGRVMIQSLSGDKQRKRVEYMDSAYDLIDNEQVFDMEGFMNLVRG